MSKTHLAITARREAWWAWWIIIHRAVKGRWASVFNLKERLKWALFHQGCLLSWRMSRQWCSLRQSLEEVLKSNPHIINLCLLWGIQWWARPWRRNLISHWGIASHSLLKLRSTLMKSRFTRSSKNSHRQSSLIHRFSNQRELKTAKNFLTLISKAEIPNLLIT